MTKKKMTVMKSPLTIRTMNFTRSTAKLKLVAIEKSLRDQSKTVRQLAADIHASEPGLWNYIVMLHETAQIHICGWHRFQTKRYETKMPIYAWGKGEDVPKPTIKTPLMCYYERMAKLNKDKDAKDVYLAKRRARRKKVKPDPMIVALFSKAEPEI